MGKRVDMVGREFGRLTVQSACGATSARDTIYRCLCSCGGVAEVPGGRLRFGQTKSCGCIRRESAPWKPTHGMSKHELYPTWQAMMSRCYNEENIDFVHYGGRGIEVAAEWHDVKQFIADMHPRPQGLTLDRRDNDKGYSAINCRWASMTEQNNNKRTTP